LVTHVELAQLTTWLALLHDTPFPLQFVIVEQTVPGLQHEAAMPLVAGQATG
jgi:hypothetical protein